MCDDNKKDRVHWHGNDVLRMGLEMMLWYMYPNNNNKIQKKKNSESKSEMFNKISQ